MHAKKFHTLITMALVGFILMNSFLQFVDSKISDAPTGEVLRVIAGYCVMVSYVISVAGNLVGLWRETKEEEGVDYVRKETGEKVCEDKTAKK